MSSILSICSHCQYSLYGEKFCPKCGAENIQLSEIATTCPQCNCSRSLDSSALVIPGKLSRFCGNCGFDFNAGVA